MQGERGYHLEVLEHNPHVVIHLLSDTLKDEGPQLVLQQFDILLTFNLPGVGQDLRILTSKKTVHGPHDRLSG